MHSFFEIANQAGVSNFLSGEDTLGRLLVDVAVKNLSVLPAGPTPPNAGELLAGPRLQMLIDELRQRFEYVIIDSPPVLGLADAVIIASRVEAVVYAVEANSARRGTIRTAVSRLLQAGITPVGAVLTKFEARKAQYGYGYDYGYGYGHGSKDSVTV